MTSPDTLNSNSLLADPVGGSMSPRDPAESHGAIGALVPQPSAAAHRSGTSCAPATTTFMASGDLLGTMIETSVTDQLQAQPAMSGTRCRVSQPVRNATASELTSARSSGRRHVRLSHMWRLRGNVGFGLFWWSVWGSRYKNSAGCEIVGVGEPVSDSA